MQAHGANTRKYWLVEVIENDCIVTQLRVYNEISPEPEGNPEGEAPRLVTIQLRDYSIYYTIGYCLYYRQKLIV